MKDYTQTLRSLMNQSNIPSFRALAQRANVSSWQIRQLRQGQAEQMRLGILVHISQALQISIETLIEQCSPHSLSSFDRSPHKKYREQIQHQQTEYQPSQYPPEQPSDLVAEYQRLKSQLENQKEQLQQDFQRTSLEVLESWMIYWPAAVYATKAKPDLLATRLIPLVRPIEQLLEQWRVKAIAAVGSEVPYDPQHHQLIGGQAHPGDPVRVSNPGYFHGKALIQRAKVKPIRP